MKTNIQNPQSVFAVLDSDLRYVDWPAIFAGAVLATAVSLLLLTFGASFGLAMTNPAPDEGLSLRWITIAGGIWLIWTSVSSFAAGGYLAGRLRRRVGDANADEVEARDGAHGVIVWAVGAVFGGMLAVLGVTGTLGAVGNGAGAALEAANVQLDELTGYATASLLRGDSSQGSAEAQADVAAVLGQSYIAANLSDQDRQYVENVVVAEAGVTREVAATRVSDAFNAGLEARQAALAAADQVRIAGMISAFVLAAAMLVSGAAAYFSAAAGGAHRDKHLGFRAYGK